VAVAGGFTVALGGMVGVKHHDSRAPVPWDASLARDVPAAGSIQKRRLRGLTRSLLNPVQGEEPPHSHLQDRTTDEHFLRVPQCRRRLRTDTEFEGRNSRRRLHHHADAHAATGRQVAPGKPHNAVAASFFGQVASDLAPLRRSFFCGRCKNTAGLSVPQGL
jgi:hypothetical protein